MSPLPRESTLGRGGSAFKMTVRAEGSLDGMAEQIWMDMLPRAKDAVRRGTDVVLERVDLLLSHPGAPRPGEPPREILAELRESMRRIPLRVLRYKVRSGIQTTHPGANRLEFGFTDERGIKTFPHPFARPAFQTTKGQLDRLFEGV